jgi:hypothetical protein
MPYSSTRFFFAGLFSYLFLIYQPTAIFAVNDAEEIIVPSFEPISGTEFEGVSSPSSDNSADKKSVFEIKEDDFITVLGIMSDNLTISGVKLGDKFETVSKVFNQASKSGDFIETPGLQFLFEKGKLAEIRILNQYSKKLKGESKKIASDEIVNDMNLMENLIEAPDKMLERTVTLPGGDTSTQRIFSFTARGFKIAGSVKADDKLGFDYFALVPPKK